MSYQADSLRQLLLELVRLPGIGARSAQRIAFYLLKRPPEESAALAQAIQTMRERVRHCSVCFATTEGDPCPICSDPKRDRRLLCVVEEASDVWALERTGEYSGHYHVLQGSLSPLDGRGPENLRIAELLERAKAGGFEEIILATNPSAEGEATAIYIGRLLQPMGMRVTRIARGLPAGSDLEFADDVTLCRAMEGRKEVSL
jgi:recombination protein RecR